jgi:2-polyprenyl-6-methoxyphenol hydroxylase-like FAD-dependent oxidoreductase
MTTRGTDIVVIGGGIAGSAISVVLAQAGHSVVMLEKTLVHKDVVRGEWLAPWGVIEAERLGLLEIYLVSASEAEAASAPIMNLAPEAPLCLGHPRMCNLLNDEAVALGVRYQRGIQKLLITPGKPPTVQFSAGGADETITPRWIIGADGRNGIVARQIGCTLSQDPEHHLFSGMLVENAHDWPEDLQVIASEGDAHVLAFPQGGGRVRIYLGWPSSDRGRLIGPEGPQRFLDSWDLSCVPHADVIRAATPASPCIAYPNSDGWLDSIVREGVVLIGDAAGRNDPITGQGLSITHRDVRLVSEALLNDSAWSEKIFEPYVAERAERMSRLRIVARLASLREASFGEAGEALRRSIHERVSARPELAAPGLAAFIGPEALPAEVFSSEFTEAIVGQPIWDPELP